MTWHLCHSCGKVVDVDPYVEACPECGVHIPVPPHERGWMGPPPPPPIPPMSRMYGPPGYARPVNPASVAASSRPENPEIRTLLDKNAVLEEENAKLKRDLAEKEAARIRGVGEGN